MVKSCILKLGSKCLPRLNRADAQVLLAGALYPLAFAPLHWWPIAQLALCVLLHHWANTSPKTAARRGGYFGLGAFGVGTSWVYVSIHQFGNTPPPLAAFITLGFVLLLASFFALIGLLLARGFAQPTYTRFLIGFPCLLLLTEWLRTWLFTGFPWLLAGYSQIDGPLRSFAPVVGVYGITLLLALTAGAMVGGWQHAAGRRWYLSLLVLIWGSAGGLGAVNWTTPAAEPQSVALVQGNVAPDDKFTQAAPLQAAWQTYGSQVAALSAKHKLIFWPENSVALPFQLATPLLDLLGSELADSKSSLVLGLPFAIPELSGYYYNSLTVVGQGSGTYFKRHLVPFGEYVPFERYLRGLIGLFNIPMSNFKPASDAQASLSLQTAIGPVLPLICYEIAYAETVRKQLLNNASGVILNASEDGWFGNSLGPHQHLDIARMRALETGRPVLRATTSGISAIIAADGRVVQRSAQFTPAILQGTVVPHQGLTPWMQLGLLPLVGLALASLSLAGLSRYLRRLKPVVAHHA